MSRILVTGATGFVGAAVARALLAQGHAVRTMARANSDRRNLAGLNVEIVTGDLTDHASFRPALDGCDGLFHVAADYRLWIPDPDRMHAINVDGTRALMLAALDAGVRRIVHTSSVATLGFTGDGTPADEETPNSLDKIVGEYKRSKFLGEAAVRDLVKTRGLPAVIVNPSTPIGPRDVKPTPTGRVIVDAANGKIPVYVETGLNLVHVDDVAAGHLAAFERGRIGERYILGGEDWSLQRVLQEIAHLTGRRGPLGKLPRAPLLPIAMVLEAIARVSGGEPRFTQDEIRMSAKKMYFSSAKAKRELAYAPRPAVDAIVDALAWFKANGYVT
ncbi:hopanoid-associated sugar epimerase [Roseiterribacter gracilis]|uniref:NAD-dependent dehydratase n=1 Tax=Roseiterribacter gracilis TaxID=2812848 RepID=A0A8S8XAW5_9PROT|nr:NAD-dependent dehydratase [Rhodospirillales bacterium TMPK1]